MTGNSGTNISTAVSDGCCNKNAEKKRPHCLDAVRFFFLLSCDLTDRADLVCGHHDPSGDMPRRDHADRPHMPADRILNDSVLPVFTAGDIRAASGMRVCLSPRAALRYPVVCHPDIVQKTAAHDIFAGNAEAVPVEPSGNAACFAGDMQTVLRNGASVVMCHAVGLAESFGSKNIRTVFCNACIQILSPVAECAGTPASRKRAAEPADGPSRRIRNNTDPDEKQSCRRLFYKTFTHEPECLSRRFTLTTAAVYDPQTPSRHWKCTGSRKGQYRNGVPYSAMRSGRRTCRCPAG